MKRSVRSRLFTAALTLSAGAAFLVLASGVGAQEHPPEEHGAEQEAEAHGTQAHGSGHGGLKNEIALFLGNTHKSGHDAFTIGIDYARALHPRLGLWVFGDYAGNSEERDYILGAGLAFLVVAHGGIFIGAGVEREEFPNHHEDVHPEEHHSPHGGTTLPLGGNHSDGEPENLALLRVGLTYAFHFGAEDRWGVIPQVFYDAVNGGAGAWVTGVSLGYVF